MQPQPGALPGQNVTRMVRAADGRIRSDLGKTSVITDPAARKATILDHVNKVARVVPMPRVPAAQFDPAALAGGAQPPQPPAFRSVEDLGKSMLDGLEVVGKRYTFEPPALPNAPALPQPPVVSEVWTSTRLQLPVLTKTTGSFGEQIRRCKYTESAAPPPTLFEIPEGYRRLPSAAAPG